MRLRFQLPGTQQHIQSAARVVWTDATGRIGMEFDELSEAYRVQLKSWVAAHVQSSPDEYASNDTELPVTIRVLSQWMKPLAIAIDGVFVSVAAAVFCLIAFLFLRGQAIFPLGITYLIALFMGGVVYSSLFWLMDVRFPGTRAVQGLLAAASSRQPA